MTLEAKRFTKVDTSNLADLLNFDLETKLHSVRVANLVAEFSEFLGLSDPNRLETIKMGALLHDIGKVNTPLAILQKPDRLTEEEFAVVRKHPSDSRDMLISQVLPKFPDDSRFILDMAYAHHEKWDGTGYPHGAKKEDIPLMARILSVADVWDSLVNDRYYHKALPLQEAMEKIKSWGGNYLDPRIVQVFYRFIKEKNPSVASQKEAPFSGQNLVYIKPGLGRGGLSFSDLELLQILKELGFNIKLVTGYLSNEIKDLNDEKYSYPVTTIPLLDRDSKSSVEKAIVPIEKETEKADIVLFAEPFSGGTSDYDNLTVVFASRHKTDKIKIIIRSHDPIRDSANFSKLPPGIICWPTSEVIASQMRDYHANGIILTIPEVINFDRLSSRGTKNIRESLGIREDDIMLLQPTRVDSNKGIDRALVLTKKLGDVTNKKVFLVVTGGNEPSARSMDAKTRLNQFAEELGITDSVIYLNEPPSTPFPPLLSEQGYDSLSLPLLS